MIGRAAIGNPWIFNEIKHFLKTGEKLAQPNLLQKTEAARNHLVWSCEWKGEKTGILETRRHYANYFKGIPDFKPYRTRLVTANELNELFEIFDEIEQFEKQIV